MYICGKYKDMNGADRFILGGEQPKLIVFTGLEQALPNKCIGFVPNSGGCIISSLKDDAGTELSITYGFNAVNLGDKVIPWIIKGGVSPTPPKYLKYVTGTESGSMWAITA